MSADEGRAGQEAARLVAAAQDWLRTSAPHLAPVGEDGEPCSCPLCRAVVSLREADPDSVARWVDAAVVGMSAALTQVAAAASDLAAQTRDVATPDERVEGDEGRPGGDSSPAPATPEDATGHDGPRGIRRIPLEHGLGPDLP